MSTQARGARSQDNDITYLLMKCLLGREKDLGRMGYNLSQDRGILGKMGREEAQSRVEYRRLLPKKSLAGARREEGRGPGQNSGHGGRRRSWEEVSSSSTSLVQSHGAKLLLSASFRMLTNNGGTTVCL